MWTDGTISGQLMRMCRGGADQQLCNGRLLSFSSFSAMASFISRMEKNFRSRSAAMIHVSAKRTEASAALLSWGLRTRAGTIAVGLEV